MKIFLTAAVLFLSETQYSCAAKARDYLNRVKGKDEIQSSLGDSVVKETQRHVSDPDNRVVIETYLDQILDHFDAKGGREDTFLQRYFYSDDFVSKDPEYSGKTYAFLCVGGEGPDLDFGVLINSVHCSGDMIETAQAMHDQGHSVHLFALEHRYYGYSYPDFQTGSAVSNENLTYLSSKQALADIAHFISYMNGEIKDEVTQQARSLKHFLEPFGHQDGHNGVDRWITFGGSYPGMLSAWARLKYPHLIFAAVSNSAPVQPKLDFAGYYSVVQNDLKYKEIGGSDDCLAFIKEGHEDIKEALFGEGSDAEARSRLASMFNICDEKALEDDMNARIFAGDGVIDIPAQENDPSCTESLCDIEKICDHITRSEYVEPVDVLADISNKQRRGECLVVDWKGTLQYLASPAARFEGIRSWLWQTCTEFGFYQTCESVEDCPFTPVHVVSQDLQICEVAFGISADRVKENVQNTIEYYGGRDLETSRVLFVNGDVDPWTAEAITSDKHFPTLWVPEASHHFWTHVPESSDSIWVVAARELIQVQIQSWLNEESQ